jgi:hypothetical protein
MNNYVRGNQYGTKEYSILISKFKSEYLAWRNMKKRIFNINHPKYPRYGGRGIKICDRWLESFENFLEDMGPKSSQELQLERNNNDGNYEPSNCRWAFRWEQMNNTRRNISNDFKYNGKQLF